MVVVRDARPLLGSGSTAIWETLGCGAHPGSVAQVLVARKREARSCCPRRRVVQEAFVPSLSASQRTEVGTST